MEAHLNTAVNRLLFKNQSVSGRDMFARFHSSFKLRAPDQALEKHCNCSTVTGCSQTNFKVHRFRWRRRRKRYLSKEGGGILRDERCGPGGSKLRFDQTFTRLEATNAPPACSTSHIRTCLQNKGTTGSVGIYVSLSEHVVNY